MKNLVLKPVCILAAFSIPTLAMAQDGQMDFARLAAALNMTEGQVQNCIPTDAVPGQRLSRSQRTVVIECFKTANPSLTNGDIRDAMMALRP
ncbi:MAG: hypothetical protein AB3N09_00480 [Tateyamaria sp.]